MPSEREQIAAAYEQQLGRKASEDELNQWLSGAYGYGQAGNLAPILGADRLRRDVPLAPYTTFRIGGPADLLYDATTAEELATAVTAARRAEIPVFVLGLGANILIGDLGFHGLVVRNIANAITIGADGRVRAESGATVAELIRRSVAAGWSGLEHYVGIPSTVGGAVWQNLHFLSPAPERERTMFIAEVVESVELLLAEDEATANVIARECEELNAERQAMNRQMLDEAMRRTGELIETAVRAHATALRALSS